MKQDVIMRGDDKSGAIFSACERYRYLLWRGSRAQAPYALFIMLNPSTADESSNDPTVERCARRVKTLGLQGLQVANIFALRSTDPKALYSSEWPSSEESHPSRNLEYILRSAAGAQIVICGWGNHGQLLGQGREVIEALKRQGVSPHALQMNSTGEPKHPLYIPYTQVPIRIDR